jgi:hypothetical protein
LSEGLRRAGVGRSCKCSCEFVIQFLLLLVKYELTMELFDLLIVL